MRSSQPHNNKFCSISNILDSSSELKSPKFRKINSLSTVSEFSDFSENDIEFFDSEHFHQSKLVSKGKTELEVISENNGQFQEIENYELKEVAGQGSFGVVYRAIYLPTSREVAVKKIDMQNFSQLYRDEVQKLYNQEKQICLAVKDSDAPNFSPCVIAVFETEGCGYIVNDFLEGHTLEQYLLNQQFQLTEQEIQFYLASLLLSIEEMHEKYSCVHRDIKPSNIMILPNGTLKLIDLGAAKFLNKGERTSSIVGTCEYFSPPRLRCREYGREVDIWSFAIVGYELVMRSLPFSFKNMQNSSEDEKIYELAKEIERKKKKLLFDHQYFENGLGDILSKIFNQEKQEMIEIEDIKKCEYFKMFPWPLLEKNKLQPPRQFSPQEIAKIKNSSNQGSQIFNSF